MEEFGARKSAPLETCLREIEQSDIYIGIISMCYGSIDSLTGKSYTQLEYERAKELGLEILIYLIDEGNGELKSGNIDFGEKKIYLDRFKSILKANHTVDFFVNEKDLADKISRRLKNMLPDAEVIPKRPKELECIIKKAEINNKNWMFFIGLYNGRPYEIYSTTEADSSDDYDIGVLLPRTVSSGILVKDIDDDGERVTNFTFRNKRGYKTTIEDINYNVDMDVRMNDKIISKLLQLEIRKTAIIASIRELGMEDEKHFEWSNSLINILSPLL